ncbi:MAG: DUF4097 family beta strand repeat protein, partial [Theionarchaea archaeon]|nr:MAG: hypothetical protein AYK19_05575 [Theionarchaea archaeon DG-70-1]MBU7030244.1 DUF4097 family beta strand repeat protein [Theionarchaea archaeon]
MKRLILLGVCILLLGCIDQSEKVSMLPREEVLEIFESNIEGEEISVDFLLYNGYIEVNLWDKQSYRIEATKWARATTSEDAKRTAEDVKVDFSEETETGGVTLVIETEESINAGVEITAFLPRASFETVDLSIFNGDIQVEEVTATTVSLVTINGDIKASVTADDIKVKTSNGKIRGFYQGNQVIIETTNGRIDIECGYSGEYDVETFNGDIDIVVNGDFKFNLETTVGEITVEADGVVYTLDDKDHKKGYTAEDYTVIITASTVSSITVLKQ